MATYIHSTTFEILDYTPAKRLLTTTTLDPEDLKCMAITDDATDSLATFHGQISTLSAT